MALLRGRKPTYNHLHRTYHSIVAMDDLDILDPASLVEHDGDVEHLCGDEDVVFGSRLAAALQAQLSSYHFQPLH